jgi:hypothetical protein
MMKVKELIMMIKMKMIVLKEGYKYNEDKCNNKDNDDDDSDNDDD